MRDFDHDFVDDVVERLGRVKPDAQPRWGTMTPEQMIAHLVDVVLFSMGQGGDMPDVGNWFTRNVAGPLLLHGIVRLPKNLKTPKTINKPPRTGPDDLETLHAVLEDYLGLVQSGELEPKRHPALGDLGVDDWARLHVVHFEHHMRQFGV